MALTSAARMEPLGVFPNPSNGTCTVRASGPGIYYLMNETVGLVRSFSLTSDDQDTICLLDLPTGTYGISGQTRTGIVKQKLIVSH